MSGFSCCLSSDSSDCSLGEYRSDLDAARKGLTKMSRWPIYQFVIQGGFPGTSRTLGALYSLLLNAGTNHMEQDGTLEASTDRVRCQSSACPTSST